MSEANTQPDNTPGLFAWNELASHDVTAAKAFYKTLFGWETETMNMGPDGQYVMFKIGDRPVAGMMPMPPEAEKAPTMWMGYITVKNITESVEKAKSLGGHVCKDITRIPMGLLAIIRDPQGAVFGLWECAE